MRAVSFAALLSLAVVAMSQEPASPQPDAPARLAQLQKVMLPKLVTPEGVGSRLCSSDPELQASCLEWKAQLLEVVLGEADWASLGEKPGHDARFLADMLMNGWADDAAAQEAFAAELSMAPLRSLAEYLMGREALARLREKPYELRMAALEGGEIDLAGMRGKPVIVAFWSPGCVGCRRQIPKLKTLYDRYQGEGLQIVGLCGDKDQAGLKAFVAREGMAWPQGADREKVREDFDAFGFQWVSNIMLLDTQGRLLRMEPSPNVQSWDALIRAQLDPLRSSQRPGQGG